MNNLLTKTNFKMGVTCLTKLYYAHNEYVNNSAEDAFLKGLADGGFQTNAMAKDLYKSSLGKSIKSIKVMDTDNTWDNTKVIDKTESFLLKNDECVIFEGAFEHDGMMLRADIVRKVGNDLELIEVKSKSYSELSGMLTKKGGIKTEFVPYLEDLAFQYSLMTKKFPTKNITPYLYLVNKDAVCNQNSLNQRYKINNDGLRTVITVDETIEKPKDDLLIMVDCSKHMDIILSNKKYTSTEISFEELISKCKKIIETNKRPECEISSKCKGCEFSKGFNECWDGIADTNTPMVWDINNLHFTKKNKLISKDIVTMRQLTEKHTSEYKFNTRQIDQMNNTLKSLISGNVEKTVDIEGLSNQIDKLVYPLNMIDFETTAPSIPFTKGLRPYEQVLFQFSHHIMNENGTVEHKTEYINRIKGIDPSIDAVRALKLALEQNNGTVFRYHNHENTILCCVRLTILSHIENGTDEADYQSLVDFIDTLTTRDAIITDNEDLIITKGKKSTFSGKRNMIDLCQMVKNFYQSSIMGGSNSIKFVLPSVLNTSEYIKAKYSEPIYNGLNFKNKTWITLDDNKQVVNPYKLLGDGAVCNGGEAMVNYAKIQYTDTDEATAKQLGDDLLAYCELDTMAMVFIMEHFLELTQHTNNLTTLLPKEVKEVVKETEVEIDDNPFL